LTGLASSRCIKGNHKFPKGETKMNYGEAKSSMGESVRCSRRKLSEIECESGTALEQYQEICVRFYE